MDTVSLYQCSTLRAAHKLTKMCGRKYRYVMLYKNKWIWTLALKLSFRSHQFFYWTKNLSNSQSVLANERLDFQVQAIFNVRLVYEILNVKMKEKTAKFTTTSSPISTCPSSLLAILTTTSIVNPWLLDPRGNVVPRWRVTVHSTVTDTKKCVLAFGIVIHGYNNK